MQIRKCLIDHMSQSERGVKHRKGLVPQKETNFLTVHYYFLLRKLKQKIAREE